MKKLILIIWCSLFALVGFSNTEIIKINESGNSSWGAVTLLAPMLLINSLDTLPVIDSIIYERITGDFYKRVYYPEYSIIYFVAEDSTSLDADSIALQLEIDSLEREISISDRRIDRMRDRISTESARKRQLINDLQDAILRQRELLKIRRRYYRRL